MPAAEAGPAVVVVGGGIAGSACARELQAAGVRVRLLDRSANPGGRLASYELHGRVVDLGASYVTAGDERFAAQVRDWESRGLARPWTDTFHVAEGRSITGSKAGPLRWGTAQGLRSLVSDLQRGLDVVRGREVVDVDPGPLVDGELAEAVVLAMPDPQAADLLADTLGEELDAVVPRTWEPVVALAAGWDRRSWDPEVAGVFVNADPVLGWVADDGSRRGDGAPVLVAHSTSQFAEEHLDDPPSAVGPMLAAVSQLLGVADEPEWVEVRRWSLARPAEGRDAPFHLGASMVGLCGDGWHGTPKVEAAYLSGRELGAALGQLVGG
ncbi:hypothetical protein CLV35_2175 [Motilibacter peucedani]|uniref:Amine oxidase domain-containing protein n=1 Tax=Motilibacter peucedani TaxID=598650 RepID=A0A420XQW0_9ACTN|nr:FAD-dependent oxidoreductase [Motilibacter peucedani]RKS75698.1 hypothetical protein CLV35_2175 [Motilibacter peucedani]